MRDMDLSRSFKAYDVRGRIPDELNPEAVYRIGRAYAEWLKPKPGRGRPRHPPFQPGVRRTR